VSKAVEWVEEQFQVRVPDRVRPIVEMLDQAFGGIRRVEPVREGWVNWAHHWGMELVFRNQSFDTYDGDILTRLVVLCHDRAIRMEISHGTCWYRNDNRDDIDGWEFAHDHSHPLMSDGVPFTDEDEARKEWEYMPSSCLVVRFHQRGGRGTWPSDTRPSRKRSTACATNLAPFGDEG
jgi:hypothetical protein